MRKIICGAVCAGAVAPAPTLESTPTRSDLARLVGLQLREAERAFDSLIMANIPSRGWDEYTDRASRLRGLCGTFAREAETNARERDGALVRLGLDIKTALFAQIEAELRELNNSGATPSDLDSISKQVLLSDLPVLIGHIEMRGRLLLALEPEKQRAEIVELRAENSFGLPLGTQNFELREIETAASQNGYERGRRQLRKHLAKWRGADRDKGEKWQLERGELEEFLRYLSQKQRAKP